MIEQYVRPVYQRWLVDPVAAKLQATEWLSPVQVTLLSAVLGVLVVPFLYWQQPVFAVILLLLSGYADTLDGTLARQLGVSSPQGAVLDIMADRWVEFSVIIGLYLVDPSGRGLWCLLMLGSTLLCVTSFLVVGVFMQNDGPRGFFYSAGLMERAEAFLFFVAMILWPAGFVILSVWFTVLVLLTGVIRVYQFAMTPVQEVKV